MFAPSQYSFGPFLFDARGRVLYRDGRDVGLPLKVAETLALLLANAGAVVEKGELLDLAWAGMNVGESSLTRTISILRKALGSYGSDEYITTIFKRGYRFTAPVTRAQDLASTDDQVSIAVLPFSCFSASEARDSFSDGLTEETTAQLYKRGEGWLQVIARSSCMAFKNSPKRIAEIGGELGVDFALAGSVRGNRDRVRIAAQLIRVSDEMHVWAESYERPTTGDPLRLQCAVAREIAQEVQTRLATHAIEPETVELAVGNGVY